MVFSKRLFIKWSLDPLGDRQDGIRDLAERIFYDLAGFSDLNFTSKITHPISLTSLVLEKFKKRMPCTYRSCLYL